MHVISRKKLRDFWLKHPTAEASLGPWFTVMRKQSFKSFHELRKVFPSADYVSPHTIFNVGGNNFRVITVIHYNRSKVFIRIVLTHPEYDRWNKAGRQK